MLRRAAPSLGLALSCLLGSSLANAGCPNTCAITVEPAVVDPALACLQVQVSGETCECALHLVVSNGCTSSVDFPTNTFYYCPQADGTVQNGCASVPAPGTASG